MQRPKAAAANVVGDAFAGLILGPSNVGPGRTRISPEKNSLSLEEIDEQPFPELIGRELLNGITLITEQQIVAVTLFNVGLPIR